MLNPVNCLRISLTLKIKTSLNHIYIYIYMSIYTDRHEKMVWEADLSVGKLRRKLSACSQPTWSHGVNSQEGNFLAATEYIIMFSSEQKIYIQVLNSY